MGWRLLPSLQHWQRGVGAGMGNPESKWHPPWPRDAVKLQLRVGEWPELRRSFIHILAHSCGPGRGTGSALPEPQLPSWLPRAPRELFPMGATHRIQMTPGSLGMSELEGSQDGQPIPGTDPEGFVTCPKSLI